MRPAGDVGRRALDLEHMWASGVPGSPWGEV